MVLLLVAGGTDGSKCLFTCLWRASRVLKDIMQPFIMHLNGRSYSNREDVKFRQRNGIFRFGFRPHSKISYNTR